MAKVIQVIEVEVLRGKGTEESIMRTVTQYWSVEGKLLAEQDPLATDLSGINQMIWEVGNANFESTFDRKRD